MLEWIGSSCRFSLFSMQPKLSRNRLVYNAYLDCTKVSILVEAVNINKHVNLSFKTLSPSQNKVNSFRRFVRRRDFVSACKYTFICILNSLKLNLASWKSHLSGVTLPVDGKREIFNMQVRWEIARYKRLMRSVTKKPTFCTMRCYSIPRSLV